MGIFDRIRGRNRVDNVAEARRLADIEDKARKRRDEEEKEARVRQKTEELRNQEARGKGGSLINITNIVPSPKSIRFWIIALIFLVIVLALWKFKILSFTLVYIGGAFLLLFIVYGFIKGATKQKSEEGATEIFVAVALAIWILDLVPENTFLIGRLLGPVYAGFDWPVGFIISTNWWAIMTSSVAFLLFYLNMVFDIIKRQYISFGFGFVFILTMNYLAGKLTRFIPQFATVGFSIPFGIIGFFVVLIFFGYLAYRLDKKYTASIPNFFSYLFMVLVFSFFWINNGWMGNIKAVIHAIYIIAFGFGYMMRKEKDNPVMWHLLIPALLIADFYGYGLLWHSDYLWLRFVPVFLIFVISYCYAKTENNYALTAFILLVTFVLILSFQASGYEGTQVSFQAVKGVDYKEVFGNFKDKLTEIIEGRLDIATAGLYRGSVEKNRYESLGVYFSNIRASDPRFYTDEPITVWGSIRSKTYKDAVIINFSCYRWKDNKRIYADKSIPEVKFPMFQLEDVDTQCTFLPKDEPQNVGAGANTVTLAAEYNFATDAYLKTYFIDRDRIKSYAREDIEPLTEFGIKDKNPGTVHTNGPVEIGMQAGPLVSVSKDYAVKPAIGITLTNRKEIQDKDKKIIQKWDGKIRNITELVLLVPPGIYLDKTDKCKLPKNDAGRLECPCNFPFEDYDITKCKEVCDNSVFKPCFDACLKVYPTGTQDETGSMNQQQLSCIKDCSTTKDNCKEDCNNLFNADKGEGTGNYKGYQLDLSSVELRDLNKDIDKHRTFVCRYTPSPDVLDNTPITTRYFRARARYNYVAENSVTVTVEKPPVEMIYVVPDALAKATLVFTPDNELWFPGLTTELITAIASVESKFRHCCVDTNKKGLTCVESGKKDCNPNNIITSGSSIGIMQVRYYYPNNPAKQQKIRDEVNNMANRYCTNGQTIFDYDCNVKVGVAILKSKYETYGQNGCQSNLCRGCTSSQPPYKKYSDYRNIEAALRGYNGWGCGSGADTGYVEKVLNAMKTVKGREIIDPTTLRSINRAGEGMSDATPSETDDQTLVVAEANQIPEPPSSITTIFNPQSGEVIISWTRSVSAGVISYRVARYDENNKLFIICNVGEDVKQNHACIDSYGVITGKKYIYSVTTYANNNLNSEKTVEYTING